MLPASAASPFGMRSFVSVSRWMSAIWAVSPMTNRAGDTAKIGQTNWPKTVWLVKAQIDTFLP